MEHPRKTQKTDYHLPPHLVINEAYFLFLSLQYIYIYIYLKSLYLLPILSYSKMSSYKEKFLQVYSVLKSELLNDPAFEFTDDSRQWVDEVSHISD